MASIARRPLCRTIQRFLSNSVSNTTKVTKSLSISTPLRAISQTYFSSIAPLPRRPGSLRPSFFFPRLSHPPPKIPRRKFHSGSAPASGKAAEEPAGEPTTLSARLKKLSREYGYAALAVYLGLSVLDFPFCFLAVRYLGAERIGKFEESVVSWFKNGLTEIQRLLGIDLYWGAGEEAVVVESGGGGVEAGARTGDGDSVSMKERGDAEREARKEGASLWTELVVTYAIHKSLIFIRVPLAAALTPKVVKVLRGWGYDIGKKGGVRGGVRELKKRVD